MIIRILKRKKMNTIIAIMKIPVNYFQDFLPAFLRVIILETTL